MMSAKQWLGRARYIEREIATLQEEKQREEDRVTSITQKYTKDGGGGGSKDPHKFDAFASYSRALEDAILELQRVKREIQTMIASLPDRRHREVLFYYYIQCKTLEEIAVKMHYSFRQTMRLYRAAVVLVEQRLNEKNMA